MIFFQKRKIILSSLFILFIITFFAITFSAQAQTVNVDASKLLPHVEVSFSPRSGSFVEESIFQVPIFINTRNRSINGIEVRVNFDKNKLAIINPTGGTSIIGVWVEPPKFDNTHGTASYVGVVPGGITTGAGLVGTITFKAKALGQAVISVSSNSRILLNDGLGSETALDAGRAEYTILGKAPEGVAIFSETHPVQQSWYNNNNPTFSWIKDPGVGGFSYVIDNKPNTIPENTIITEDTTQTFEKLADGLWYFHIKANKNKVWGTTGHFLVRIDTAPPAEFTPTINYLVAAVASSERTLVSFFTTDNLSGIDHYEVGVIDKSQPATESPVFVDAESPFQIPLTPNGKLQAIVRAVDKAGNVRDESVDVRLPFFITKFVGDYLVYILIAIILIGFITLAMHYLVGHHILRSIRRFRQILNNEEINEKIQEKITEKLENTTQQKVTTLVPQEKSDDILS